MILKLLLKNKIFIKYTLIGGLVAAIELLILNWLDNLGWCLIWATSVAFLASFIVGFILRKTWVFNDHNFKRVYKQLVSYLLILGVNFAINLAAMIALVKVFDWNKLWAQFVTGLFVGFIGYVFNKVITFKPILKVNEDFCKFDHLSHEFEKVEEIADIKNN